MKKLVMLTLLTLLASCGKSSSESGSPETKADPYRAYLNPEEGALRTNLVKKNMMTQKELVKILTEYQGLNRGTLITLDKFINIQCTGATGLCYVTEKE
jgi:hypothetical protein